MAKNEIEKVFDLRLSELRDDLQKQIDLKTSEAKLEVSEKRLNFALKLGTALIAIFGVFLPILIVVLAKLDIEKRFEQLAGTQPREPDVECFFNGDIFRGGTLTSVQYEMQEFLIKNVGDGPAENVVIRLYLDVDEHIPVRGISGPWDDWNISDETDFTQVSVRYLFFALGSRLIPQDSQTFGIQIDEEIRAKAMLKILYGHEPRRIPFTLVVQKKK